MRLLTPAEVSEARRKEEELHLERARTINQEVERGLRELIALRSRLADERERIEQEVTAIRAEAEERKRAILSEIRALEGMRDAARRDATR